MTAPLRIACLGAGYFSQFHIDGWRRIPGTTLVGVADTTLSKAAATGAPAFDSFDALLATKPDIIDIILPPPGHADAIRSALAAKPRAIICQKPFCTSLEQTREITALAMAAKIPLIVHENFRFQPWYRAIKQALDAGRIGTPLQATFRLRPGDGQGPHAYLARQPYFQQMPRFLIHETGVHWIDTFRYLFGNPSHVYADLRRVNPVISGEDAGFVTFDHPNGLRALFDANRHLDHAADNPRRTMGEALIEGTDGTLDLAGDGAVWHRAFGSQTRSEILPPDTHAGFGGDYTRALQNHVVSALLTGSVLENQAHDYLRVIYIEQAVYLSAATGRKLEI
ncbi:Predicted dehydrogenase [Pseudorhodobacter antarcticus]|uniref:Predicted dehydrogenase n=1 Tax=Pseudorhodobacter antarcticus TaxID=1077947 RepID=A0A1H8KSK8_9RHOB|nr:Gfo/Idh/MocA family oxidoreductase [Pseudorhodobacter antarcticus]SEN95398.1 Predicted dehydrogenase [Pseudorhodobacter antarcticus]